MSCRPYQVYAIFKNKNQQHPPGEPLQIVVGAGNKYQEGWIPIEQLTLDILKWWNWKYLFGKRKIDHILAEHVWEQLTLNEANIALKNCHHFLKGGGRVRLAAPDGHHPDPEYIEYVKPGGTGK